MEKIKISKVLKKLQKLSRLIVSNMRQKYISISNDSITIGKNVYIGKNVTINTTDRGKIEIGDNIAIEDNTIIYAQGGEVYIKNNTFIGSGTHIISKKKITIGYDCLIAAYCIIRDSNHMFMDKTKKINEQSFDIKEICIGDDIWLAAHVVVVAGCKINNGVVVGAQSVVTKDIESYSVVAGVPAKFIKNRE